MSAKQGGSSARSSSTYDGFPSYSKNDTLPLVNSIAEQNQFLSKQIEEIQIELKNLSKISQYTFVQNKQLKLHFQRRTNDIRSYITSLQINMNQQMQDTYHQIHLSSESNYALAKSIQQILPVIGQSNQLIKQFEIEKIGIDEELINLQNQKQIVNKAKMQTTLNQKNVQKMAKYQDKLTAQLQELQQQIGSLSIHVGQIKNGNKYKNQQLLKQKQLNNQMRSSTKQVIIHTLSHIKQLKRQLQKVQTQFLNQQNQHGKCFNRHNQIQRQVKQLQKQRVQQRILWEKQQIQIRLIRQRLGKIKHNVNQVQLKKHQKQQEKQQLQKKLKKKTINILNLKQSNFNSIQIMREEAKQIMSSIKTDQAKRQIKFTQQNNKFRQENIKLQEKIQILQKQFEILNTDFEEYSQFVKSLDNPVNQIQRIQMRMRLKQGSRPLASIF